MLFEQKLSVEEAEEMLDALDRPVRAPNKRPRIDLVGESEGARALNEKVLEVARTDAPVLVYGETGTGKALIARAIHFSSSRADGPFVVQGCLEADSLDLELFGQEESANKGLLEMAEGGTLALDFTEALSSETQHRLYSYLEHGYFTRVGGVTAIYADVRIMGLTHVNLEDQVRAGRFREDLYERLSLCYVFSPPLRDRPGDIPILTRYFIQKQAERDGQEPPQVSDEVWTLLENSDWPQNIRGLHIQVEKAVMACEGEALLPEHFPDLNAA